MSDLIVLKQLPIIEQQLQSISQSIDKRVEEINNLEVNEETIKEVKKVRTDFKKDFNELEEKRKEVKKKIEEPYKEFEEIYKTYVTNKFTKADGDLKTKIDTVEQKLKDKKEKEVKEYFEEYKKANNIDFVEYKQLGIKIGLSDSLKSLKEQVKQFIDQRIDDLELINTQEHKTEILVEYKQTLNVSSAITTVNNRFKAIEEEKKKEEQEKKLQQFIIDTAKESDKYVQCNDVLQAPVEEKIVITKFTVKSTKIKLKELKKFLDEGGYIYE